MSSIGANYAHAQNLRDSGVKVVVSDLPGSPNAQRAEKAGFSVLSAADAARQADVVMMLVPDDVQARLYKSDVAPNLKAGNALAFAHGFNIHFNQIVPPADVDVIMVAPKGPGHLVRRQFEEGKGVPVADRRLPGRHRQGQGPGAGLRQGHRRHARRRHRDHLRRRDRDRPLRRAGRALRRRHRAHQGRVRHAGRGGLPARDRLLRVPARAEADRRPHLEKGISGMRYSISDTAEYGDLTRGPVVDQRGHARPHAQDARRRPAPAPSRASGSSRTRPAGRSSTRCSGTARST